MDLTLPKIPGALLGYRRNGQPIYLAAGGAPEDESDTDQTEETDDSATEEPDDTDWKAEAQRYRDKFEGQRKVNRDLEAKLKANRPADKPATGNELDDDDPRLLAAIERELEAAAKSAAYTVGGDAPKLLDSLAFRKKLDDLDPLDANDFERQVAELMRAELKTKKTPKAPSTSGGEFTGGSGSGSPITQEQLAKASPEQVAKWFGEGRLKHLL